MKETCGNKITKAAVVINSDEHTENVYFRLRQFSERHQYDVKQLGSPAQMKKQHKMITHWNSNNI